MQIFCKFVLPKMGHSFRVLLGLCTIFRRSLRPTVTERRRLQRLYAFVVCFLRDAFGIRSGLQKLGTTASLQKSGGFVALCAETSANSYKGMLFCNILVFIETIDWSECYAKIQLTFLNLLVELGGND